MDRTDTTPSPTPDREREGRGTQESESRLPPLNHITYDVQNVPPTDEAPILEHTAEGGKTENTGPSTVTRRKHARQERKMDPTALHSATQPCHTRAPDRALTHHVGWANEIFAGAETASHADVTALLEEAADAARNDFDESSALA